MKKSIRKTIAAASLLAAMLAVPPTVWSAQAASGSGASAGQQQTVKLTYAAAAINLPMGVQVPAGQKLKLSAPVHVLYATGNPAVAKVNAAGVLMPVAPGRTTLTISVSPASAGYAGTLKLPVTVVKPAVPVELAFEPKLEVRTVKAAGRSFAVRAVTIPKGMPVTAGYANRRIGTTQSLAGVAPAYQADIAINGAFFDSYSGIPDPYGMLISGGQPAHIGNTGTTIGFKWDGSAVMDTLRLSIDGTVSAADGRTRSWYAYFMNRLPRANRPRPSLRRSEARRSASRPSML